MKKVNFTVMKVLLFLIISAQFAAAFPENITYQGVLADVNGTPLNGTYDLTVKLYSVELEGSPLWAETHSNVVVQGGVFTVLLGNVTPFSTEPELKFDSQLYLGVSIGTGTELEPRLQLASVGSALMAKEVPDGSITSAKLVAGSMVNSINGITDSVTVTGSGRVTVSETGNAINIDVPTPSTISCNWVGWKDVPNDRTETNSDCSQNNTSPLRANFFEMHCEDSKVTQTRFRANVQYGCSPAG